MRSLFIPILFIILIASFSSSCIQDDFVPDTAKQIVGINYFDSSGALDGWARFNYYNNGQLRQIIQKQAKNDNLIKLNFEYNPWDNTLKSISKITDTKTVETCQYNRFQKRYEITLHNKNSPYRMIQIIGTPQSPVKKIKYIYKKNSSKDLKKKPATFYLTQNQNYDITNIQEKPDTNNSFSAMYDTSHAFSQYIGLPQWYVDFLFVDNLYAQGIHDLSFLILAGHNNIVNNNNRLWKTSPIETGSFTYDYDKEKYPIVRYITNRRKIKQIEYIYGNE